MRVCNLRKKTFKTNNPLLFNKKEGAFTLVELIVTITLIVIFVTMAVSYNRSIGQQISLFKDQGSLVNAIYQARSLAIKTFSRAAQSADVPCGYGIHIESGDTIVLFKDLPTGGVCNHYSPPFYSGNQEDVEKIHLSGTTVNTPAGDITSGVDILFVPPDPQVFSNRDFPIELKISSPQVSDVFTISVNQFGQVSIQ